MLDKVVQFAKDTSRVIVESGEEHIPLIIAITPKGLDLIKVVGIDKTLFGLSMGSILRHIHAHAYVFINEGWTITLPDDSPKIAKLLTGEMTVDDIPLDDKTEVLTIAVAENRKSYYVWSANILYTPESKRYLGEWELAEGKFDGQMVLKEW